MTDAVLAVGVGTAELVSLAVVSLNGPPRAPLAAYLVLALSAVPLAGRRVWPLWSWAAAIAATIVYGLSEWPDPPMYLAGLIALYTVASLANRPVAVAVGGVTVVLVVAGWAIDPAATDLNDVLTPLLASTTAWVAGRAVSAQRRTIDLLGERADRLERDHEEEAARIVIDERLRIARELHDITAHHVTVIAIQAEAGATASESPALRAISSSARAALDDLRRMLAVLRDDATSPTRRPQPGLRDLPTLVQSTRSGGLPVEIEVRGDVESLPEGLDLAAFRIVQEALTNAVRHSGASRATVLVEVGAADVAIRVADDGVGIGRSDRDGSSGREGHGLLGIRERVALYGGSLTIEPGTAGGFHLRATLIR